MGRVYGDPVAHSFGLGDAPRLLTSSLDTAQIAISRLSIGPDRIGLSPVIPAEDTFVAAVYLTDLPHHELWSHGRPILRQGYRRNALRIVHLGQEFAARVTAPHDALTIYLPRRALDEFAEDAGIPRIRHFDCEPGIVDPVVGGIVAALLPAFDAPGDTSPLFVDHIALALSAHFAGRYGGRDGARRPSKGGLSPRQLARAEAYIGAHYASDFGLADVARHCGMSRAHFARAFKTSTGITPHQWLLRHRVEQAKAMMLATRVTIADVATACGFVDQSHITRVFRRLVGASPAEWRRRRRM